MEGFQTVIQDPPLPQTGNGEVFQAPEPEAVPETRLSRPGARKPEERKPFSDLDTLFAADTEPVYIRFEWQGRPCFFKLRAMDGAAFDHSQNAGQTVEYVSTPAGPRVQVAPTARLRIDQWDENRALVAGTVEDFSLYRRQNPSDPHSPLVEVRGQGLSPDARAKILGGMPGLLWHDLVNECRKINGLDPLFGMTAREAAEATGD